METIAFTAIATLSGAVGGALITGAVQMFTAARNARERRREQLIERAYQVALTEFQAQREEGTRRANMGLPGDVPAFAHYLSYNLVLLSHLVDTDHVKQLDADSIAGALDHASAVSLKAMQLREANRLARMKGFKAARAGNPGAENQDSPK